MRPSDFYRTLSFATDQPVFDLAAGYTANSSDGGIANNIYTVPEPGAATLLLLAAPLTLLRRRRAGRK